MLAPDGVVLKIFYLLLILVLFWSGGCRPTEQSLIPRVPESHTYVLGSTGIRLTIPPLFRYCETYVVKKTNFSSFCFQNEEKSIRLNITTLKFSEKLNAKSLSEGYLSRAKKDDDFEAVKALSIKNGFGVFTKKIVPPQNIPSDYELEARVWANGYEARLKFLGTYQALTSIMPDIEKIVDSIEVK